MSTGEKDYGPVRVHRKDASQSLFATPEEGVRLIRAFASISNAATRRAIVEIVTALANNTTEGGRARE